MKILLIGLGRWGKNHLKTLWKMGHELYVSDLLPASFMACEEFAIPKDHLTMNYQTFLYDMDGVIIATPADSHFNIVTECLNAGKDVFVEKPMAMTVKEAQSLLWNAKGTILQVGHLYRYHPITAKIKEMIDEGQLGEIQYAYGHFMGFKRPRTDVGVTQTDAIHWFDLFNFLFGEIPSAVTAVVRNYLGSHLDDTSVSVLDYRGKLVFIEAGYMPPEKKRDIAIVGARGSLYCDFDKGKIVFCGNQYEIHNGQCVAIEGKAREIGIRSEEPMAIELKAFLDSIRDRSQPLADGWAGYRALRVVEACYESSMKGARVELR